VGCVPAREDNEIDREIKEYRDFFKNQIKLLLLGAGESGKSTFLKQVKLIHLEAFNDVERADYTTVIYSNVIESMLVLMGECETRSLKLSKKNRDYASLLQSCNTFDMSDDIAKAIKQLWKDPKILEVWDVRNEFQVLDSASYFFDKIDTIAEEDYIPSIDDILKSRSKTTGIIEVRFQLDGSNFLVVDVAGQRSERRKWLHCFEEITAILFFVGISEYDQVLVEDSNMNRMHEAVNLFSEICNSRWFGKVDIILFLNKDDLFRDKIKRVDMKPCFPEYKGGCNYENGIKFLKKTFENLNLNNKELYTHVTVATNTENIQRVLEDVTHMIIENILRGVGF